MTKAKINCPPSREKDPRFRNALLLPKSYTPTHPRGPMTQFISSLALLTDPFPSSRDTNPPNSYTFG